MKMKWLEIKKALADGVTVERLAAKEGVPYKTMYQRIKSHEKYEGKIYMMNSHLRARAGRKPAEKADKIPEVAQLQQPNPKYSADYVAPVPEGRKLPEISPFVMSEIQSKIVAINSEIARLQKRLDDW